MSRDARYRLSKETRESEGRHTQRTSGRERGGGGGRDVDVVSWTWQRRQRGNLYEREGKSGPVEDE